ncbi:MAG: AEC family transporter [Capsulimonadaceae bacterium]
MAIFAETLRVLAPLFILMVLGAGLARVGVLRPEHAAFLNNLVMWVTLPALVLRGIVDAPNVPAATFWLPGAAFTSEIVAMALLYAVGRACRIESPRAGALLLVGPFGNTGFLGYPITLALFPHQFTAAILLDQFGMGLPMYAVAPVLGALFAASVPESPAQPARSMRADALVQIVALFRSPLFACMGLGAVIRLMPWPAALRHSLVLHSLGGICSQCLGILGAATVPLILLALGASLRPAGGRGVQGAIALAATAKFLVAPVVMLALLHLLHVRGELLTAGVMLTAMPTSVMSSVLARYYGMDGDFAVAVVFVTTVLAALAIPFWVSVVH